MSNVVGATLEQAACRWLEVERSFNTVIILNLTGQFFQVKLKEKSTLNFFPGSAVSGIKRVLTPAVSKVNPPSYNKLLAPP